MNVMKIGNAVERDIFANQAPPYRARVSMVKLVERVWKVSDVRCSCLSRLIQGRKVGARRRVHLRCRQGGVAGCEMTHVTAG